MNGIRRKCHKARPDSTLPLINIVLLLVLAFMIAGTFREPLPAGFEPVRAERGESLAQAPEPLILVVSAEGVLSLNGVDIAAERESVTFERDMTTVSRVEIRADARTPAVRVIGLLRAAEQAGWERVEVVTLGRGA